MKEFNLEAWMCDKEQRLVTRRGDKARIISIDRINDIDRPIVALVLDKEDGVEHAVYYDKNGRIVGSIEYDLFVVDPLYDIINELVNYIESTPPEKRKEDFEEINKVLKKYENK